MSRPYFFMSPSGRLIASFNGVDKAMLPTYKPGFTEINFGNMITSQYSSMSDNKEPMEFKNLPPVAGGISKGGSMGTAAINYPFQNRPPSVNPSGAGKGQKSRSRPTFKSEAELMRLMKSHLRK